MRGRICLSLLSFAALSLSGAAGADEYRGTVAQQLACTPDVLRLCSSEIPDTDRIVQCLRRNMPQLSTGCHAVFEANASMPQADKSQEKPQAKPQAKPQGSAPQAREPKGRATPAAPAAPPPSDEDD